MLKEQISLFVEVNNNQKVANQTEQQLNRRTFAKPNSQFTDFNNRQQQNSFNYTQEQRPATYVSSLPRKQYSSVTPSSKPIYQANKLNLSHERIHTDNRPEMFNREFKKPQLSHSTSRQLNQKESPRESSQYFRPTKLSIHRSKSIEVNKEWDQVINENLVFDCSLP